MAIDSDRAGQTHLEGPNPGSGLSLRGLSDRFPSVPTRVAAFFRLMRRNLGAFAATLATPFMPAIHWLADSALSRFITSSLRRRIVIANVVGVMVLLAGWVYIAQNQDGPTEARRASLEAQGRLMAAAIVSNAKVENRDIVIEADKLSPLGRAPLPFRDDGFAALELTIGPERVAPVLSRMIEGTSNRARVYTRDGSLLVDSRKLDFTGLRQKHQTGGEPANDDQMKVKDFWTRFSRFITRTKLDVLKEIGAANAKSHPLTRAALDGKPSAAILLNEDNDEIVAVALPLVRMGATHGVLLLTARPGELEKIRNKERRRIVPLVLMALVASIMASLLLVGTVAKPMKQLAAAADHVSHNINARNELPNFGDREDEVGQLSRAFNKMTAALYRRAEASEKFAADVAHELKNPLTAARSTAESLHYAKTDEKRAELVVQINAELKRLNKLITDVSNTSRMEAELALRETTPVEVESILRGVVSIFEDRAASGGPRIEMIVAPNAAGLASVIPGHAGRIGQVFTNLIDNAMSFSPDNGVVQITLGRDRDELDIRFTDQGPGVPEDMREKIFERFYTYRPTAESSRGNNSGLGLSISREIVRAHDGLIWVEPGVSGGSCFVVRLPIRTRKLTRRPTMTTARRG